MLKRTCLSVFLLVAVACGGGKSTPTTPSPSPTTPTRIIGLSGNLAFGNVQVGNTASATLTITNSGNSTVTVSGMTITGDWGSCPTACALTANWQSGAIAAGGSQQVTIRFAPTAAQTYTGTLTVNGDQTSGTNTISASGTGTAITPTRIIGLSGNLAFGNVQVGNTASATLTITNSGNSTLTVSGMAVTGGWGGALTANWLSGAIAAGGSQQVSLAFAPTAAQTYTGTLTVNGDQTSGINAISVSGTGTAVPVTQCRYPQGKLRVQITSTRCQALSNATQTMKVIASSPQISAYLASGKAVCSQRSGNGCGVPGVYEWTLTFWFDVRECGTHDFDLATTFGPAMDNTAINITDTVSFCPFYSDGTPAGTCVQALGLVQQCDTAGVILMPIK